MWSYSEPGKNGGNHGRSWASRSVLMGVALSFKCLEFFYTKLKAFGVNCDFYAIRGGSLLMIKASNSRVHILHTGVPMTSSAGSRFLASCADGRNAPNNTS